MFRPHRHDRPGFARAELVIKPVFGPADPGGPYKHPAAIEELANGDLYIVFYGGQGEYEGDTAVYGSRLAKGVFEQIRASGRKVVPRCSFMAGWVSRHPEYDDIVAG